jgi:succinate-acetate transporter protein
MCSGVFFFMGGLLMILGGVMEFILGNTFPFVLFCGYGT